MKYALVLAALVSTNAFANANPQQVFTHTHIAYWMAGAEDVVIGGGVKEQCGPQDEALAKQGAEADALADCNSNPGGYRCFVSASQITYNGDFSDAMLQKYGLQNSQFSLNTIHGCEATATVFGF